MAEKKNPLIVPVCTSTNKPEEIEGLIDCIDAVNDVETVLTAYHFLLTDIISEKDTADSYVNSIDFLLHRVYEAITAQLAGVSEALTKILRQSKPMPH